jgi:hypothetical protein
MPEIYIADVPEVTLRLADELRSAAPQAIAGRDAAANSCQLPVRFFIAAGFARGF